MKNFINKINGKNSIKSATVILIVTLFLSNILGLLRDHFLARKIPTTILDTYYTAFRIPDLVFNILILGAITASFIPIFTQYIVNKKLEKGWRIVNSFINISLLGISICLVVLYFLMPQIINFMVSDFDTEKRELTINLSRIILASPLLFTLSYIFGAVLNSFKRFFVYSLAPLIYNASIIVSTIFFSDKLGIYAVVYGVIIGAFFHMFIQLVQTIKIGYKYNLIFDYKDKVVQKIFLLMIPRAIGLGSNQIMLVFYTAIASSLTAGSVAIYNLADNIQTMPTVVFGISFATAIFPTLSEHINLRKLPEFSTHIHKSMKAIAYVLIPLSVFIFLLRAQIIRLILGSGYFGWSDTILAYNTLGYFMISLLFQGLIPLFARAYYAMHDTKTPTIISVISVIVGIVMAYILTPSMGVPGMALSFSIASIINASILYIILRKKVSEIKIQEKGILIYILKILASSLIMAIVMQVSKNITGNYLDLSRFWGVFYQITIAFVVALVVFMTMAKIVRCKEQEYFVNLIKLYLFKHENKKR